jgi:hypothetical protein
VNWEMGHTDSPKAPLIEPRRDLIRFDFNQKVCATASAAWRYLP